MTIQQQNDALTEKMLAEIDPEFRKNYTKWEFDSAVSELGVKQSIRLIAIRREISPEIFSELMKLSERI